MGTDGASLLASNPLKDARVQDIRDFESLMALGWFEEEDLDTFLTALRPDAPRYPEPSAN